MLQLLSIMISVLALLLSGFTFYWTTLRKRRSLTLLYVSRIASYDPRFVIANGCNFDVFIARLVCAYVDADGKGRMYPLQRCDALAPGGVLISAGKALSCHVVFHEQMDKDDLQRGIQSPNISPPVQVFGVVVQVHWIESSGREYQCECQFSEYGFNDKSEVVMSLEKERRFDLYSKKEEIHPGTRPTVP